MEALLRLRQVTCHPGLLLYEQVETQESRHSESQDSAKTEYLKILLPKLVQSGRKIIIFSHFSSFLHLLQGKIYKLGLTSLVLDGQTSNREETIARFQNESDLPILLASIRVGGVGLNLTAADCCILMEPWWNPSVEVQAIDRIHRIGQKKSIDVYRLYCKDSIEEKIIALQNSKDDRFQKIKFLGDLDTAAFSSEQLLELFSPSLVGI